MSFMTRYYYWETIFYDTVSVNYIVQCVTHYLINKMKLTQTAKNKIKLYFRDMV